MAERITPVTADKFGEMLVAAGLMTQEDLDVTSRVVIDAQAGYLVSIYVSKLADKGGLARLMPMFGDMIPPEADDG